MRFIGYDTTASDLSSPASAVASPVALASACMSGSVVMRRIAADSFLMCSDTPALLDHQGGENDGMVANFRIPAYMHFCMLHVAIDLSIELREA